MEIIKPVKEISLTKKLIAITLLVLVMLIPLFFVRQLVKEREGTMHGAINNTSRSWGGTQLIGTPILTVPYETWVKVEKEDDDSEKSPKFTLVRQIHYIRLIPTALSIQANFLSAL